MSESLDRAFERGYDDGERNALNVSDREQLERMLFNESEGTNAERAYRRGWNAAVRRELDAR